MLVGNIELSERMNLEIVRRFAEAGIELVPPTTKTQLIGDGDASPEVPAR